MKDIKVGIMGYGFSGRVFHYPVINAISGLRVVAVMERKAENRHLVPPGVAICESPEALIAHPELDLVVLPVPNAVHFSLAKACLQAGKHVVVEKPFTVTEAEAAELCSLAEGAGRLLAVYHNRRFDADFLTIQHLLKQGRLGSLISYEAHFDRFRKAIKPGWREAPGPGSGIVYDLGSHLIDQALVLFGEPASVSAFIRRERPEAQADDAFDIHFEYPAGPSVWLRATMLAREAGPRYIINGSEGSFIKRGIDRQEERLKAGEQPSDDPLWGAEPESDWGKLYTEHNGIPHNELIRSEDGDYRLFYEDVRDAICQKREPLVTGRQGQKVVRAIERALQSAREGRRVAWG